MELVVINGPNLNLLGKREPNIYGNQSFDTFFDQLQERYPNIQLSYFQSNSEGALISEIQHKGFSVDGILLNAGAYTHTSIAIRDAIAAVSAEVIEIHISNVHHRETFRHQTFIGPVCKGTISGLGLTGYRLGIEYFLEKNQNN